MSETEGSIFTVEMDEILRDAQTNPRYRALRSVKKWIAISKTLPGTTPEECAARWDKIKMLPGLEYKSLAEHSIPMSLPVQPKYSDTESEATMDTNRTRTSSFENGSALQSDAEQPTSPVPIRSPLPMPQQGEMVTLHVLDEHRKVNKDFTCQKDLLLSEMKYFRNYLQDGTNADDIDISVHCDVKIFEWLIGFLTNTVNPPRFETATVVSILISSDFLQMDRLVRICLQFIKTRMNDIIKMPIDLNCIRDELVRQLADMCSDTELDNIRDPKEKLLGRIYLKKIEDLFSDTENPLQRCAFCGKLFTFNRRKDMMCTKAKIFIDFHGNVMAEHVMDRNFDLNSFLQTLRNKKMAWRDIYWRLWGLQYAFECLTCGIKFPANGSNTGSYPCCQSQALRFDLSVRKIGCCARQHQPKTLDPTSRAIYDILMKHQSLVLIPFGGPADDIGIATKHSAATAAVTAARSDSEDGEEQSDTESYAADDDMVNYSSDDSDQDEYMGQGQRPKRGEETSRAVRKPKPKGDRTARLSPRRKRLLNMDQLRDEDFLRMESLTKQLDSMRRDPKRDRAEDTIPYAGTYARIAQQIRNKLAKASQPTQSGLGRPPSRR